jgi:putative membrane protein
MSPAAQSLLNEWSPPLAVDLALLFTSVIYLRGWLSLRRSSSSIFSIWRPCAFLSAMFFLWFAIGSPLSAFDEASLTVHMVQHILLMLVVPPLALLGVPAIPLLHGLPQFFLRFFVGPVFRWPPLHRVGTFITHPAFCWISAAVALIAWHVPAAFELALGSDLWHEVEHLCFLSTSILFWWPVIQPFPSAVRWPRWSIPIYLFIGMFPGGALGAFLVFCDRLLYPSYQQSPAIFARTPLTDQTLAGALMWVLGTFVYLVPAFLITLKLLSPPLECPPLSPPESSLQNFPSAGAASQL